MKTNKLLTIEITGLEAIRLLNVLKQVTNHYKHYPYAITGHSNVENISDHEIRTYLNLNSELSQKLLDAGIYNF